MPFAGQYENMTFPEYVFKEYPKEVTLKSGEKKVVQNAAEELALATEVTKPVDAQRLAVERDAVTNALAAKEAELAAKEAKIKELQALVNAKNAGVSTTGATAKAETK